ncbi:hypothetical protein B0H19DRAFT_391335 [Mycena capillaripes]|nr:hypothetical protein B0H19DRAFT_391335 [Mycena capillaripes]
MLAMFVLWAVVFLANAVYADFHFLSCVASGPSPNTIVSNPTIAVPTSDLASCDGILGERMLIVQNLTQPVGQASVFSMNNFCQARRLDIRLASSDLLGIFFSGGDGTLLGECSPSPATKFSCSSPNLSLDCTDSWTCFSGICEAPRAGSVTTPLPVSSSASATSSVSPTLVPPPPSNTSVPDIHSSPSGVGSSSAKIENGKSSPKTSIIVGVVLGVISLSCPSHGTAHLAAQTKSWQDSRSG